MAVDLGDVLRLNFTNLSPAGALVSADTMTVTVTLPDLTTAGPTTVAPDTTGVYHHDYQTTVAGRHSVRWLGTGANPGAHADVFDVRPANPPYLVSLASAKSQLNLTGTEDDDELRQVIEAATAAVERHLDMAVVARTVVEKRDMGNPAPCFEPGVLQRFTVTKKPVLSLTSIESADGAITWDTDGMQATDAGVVRVLTGSVVWGPVVFIYVAGMQVIPAHYLEAAEIIIQHLWQTQRGSMGAPFAGGMDTPGAGFTGMGYSIPNAAMELLGERVGGIA